MKGMGLLLVVGAGLVALAATSSAQAKPAQPGPKGPLGPPEIEPPDQGGPASAFDRCVDPGMPDALKLEAQKAFAAKTLMPADYEGLSEVFASSGYPIMAECIAKLGRDKAASMKAEVARRGGLPHVIRQGDIPSLMATYYTGSAMRFKEFGPLNPQIGSLKTVNGVTNYTKWIPGTEILIPAAWNPLDKPIPPVARGGKIPTDKQVEQQTAEGSQLIADTSDAVEAAKTLAGQAASAAQAAILETARQAEERAIQEEADRVRARENLPFA